MQIAICEINKYNQIIHRIIPIEEFYNYNYKELINNLLSQYNYYLSIWSDHLPQYQIIQNTLIHNPFIQIEIIYQYEPLCVKTCYIRLIQRYWRKIYNVRYNILLKRKQPYSIRVREITGKWPKSLCKWPKY
tara:strand:+ start:1165 stop:1560 length:396 start_codon:yes stop_codon:yes gene_type:complete